MTVSELPALIAKLVGDAVTFLEERLRLAQDEWRQELRRLKSAGVGLVVALVLGFMGIGLVSAGLLVLLATAGLPTWALLLGGGVVYIGIAAVLVARFSRVIENPADVFQASLGEIEKDKEWIQGR